MLSHQDTMKAISLAQKGDNDAMTLLLEQNKPLLKSIIKRYLGKNVEYEDLLQIASIGLIKAVNNFSENFNVKFSTYAVPMILGEVKRFMRDDGYIKVSRATKSICAKIKQYIDTCEKKNGVEPKIEEVADAFNMDIVDVVFALDSSKMPTSLYEKFDDNDGKATELIDRIPAEEENVGIEDKVALKNVISTLPEREQKIINLRYFHDLTQGEIANIMGVSQVQVSRLESKILEKLRKKLNE